MLEKSLFLSMGVLAAISCPVLAENAGGSDVSDQASLIRKEIQQMRNDYEARIKLMETRIAQLENEQESTETAVQKIQESSPAPRRVVLTKKSSVEGSKSGLVTEEVELPEDFSFDSITRGVTYSGYFRAGYGINGEGKTMEAFKAPGSQAKYRLGNETETYLETAFGYTFPELDLAPGTEFAVHFRPAYVVNNAADSNLTDLTVREAYGEAKGVWQAQPEASFWAGQRFYSRMDVHMNDFYYMDMSGYGGGIENLDVGIGKLAVAWLGGNIDALNSNASQLTTETDNKNTLDFRLSDIDVLGGKGLVWASVSQSDDVLAPNGINVEVDDSIGAAFGLAYRIPDVFSGMNDSYSQTMVQYGFGSSANFRATQSDFSFAADEIDFDNPTPIVEIDPDDAWHFRLTQDVVYQPHDKFAIQGTFVWDELDFGASTKSRQSWISGGARGVYFLTDYLSLALEAGIDHVSGDNNPSGNLYKVTFAPQITPKHEYFSRPALRLFVTYAAWDDDLTGYVAPDSYGMDNRWVIGRYAGRSMVVG